MTNSNSSDRLDWNSPDWFLQYFVRLANTTEISIGIILNVGGLIVSGELVSGKRYFEGLAQEMATANADDVKVE